MDSFEITKIVGALLAAGLVVSFSGFITDQFYPKPVHVAQAYNAAAGETPEARETAAPETAAPETAATAAPGATGGAIDVVALIAAAEPEAGKKVFKKCGACHNPDKGGKRKIGPNLWAVVDRPIASAAGFTFSGALMAKSGETWSYENLDAFLKKPKDWARGTKMTFPGLKKPEQRAAVIAYLRSLSDNPAALPK